MTQETTTEEDPTSEVKGKFADKFEEKLTDELSDYFDKWSYAENITDRELEASVDDINDLVSRMRWTAYHMLKDFEKELAKAHQ
jgi:hypothetical protein